MIRINERIERGGVLDRKATSDYFNTVQMIDISNYIIVSSYIRVLHLII